MLTDRSYLRTPRRALTTEQLLVIRGLYGDGFSERDLAEILGLTRDRVHRIEREAVARMRRSVAEAHDVEVAM